MLKALTPSLDQDIAEMARLNACLEGMDKIHQQEKVDLKERHQKERQESAKRRTACLRRINKAIWKKTLLHGLEELGKEIMKKPDQSLNYWIASSPWTAELPRLGQASVRMLIKQRGTCRVGLEVNQKAAEPFAKTFWFYPIWTIEGLEAPERTQAMTEMAYHTFLKRIRAQKLLIEKGKLPACPIELFYDQYRKKR